MSSDVVVQPLNSVGLHKAEHDVNDRYGRRPRSPGPRREMRAPERSLPPKDLNGPYRPRAPPPWVRPRPRSVPDATPRGRPRDRTTSRTQDDYVEAFIEEDPRDWY
jgi:hypothetical protein